MTNPIADPIVEVNDTETMTPLVHIDSTPDGAVTVRHVGVWDRITSVIG